MMPKLWNFGRMNPSTTMVLWGGLRPIAIQVAVDIFGLAVFGYASYTEPTTQKGIILILGCLLTVLLSGNLTNRWTIIFPMIPFVVLQLLRRLNKKKWIGWIIGILSFLLIFVAAALSVLFPAVELPFPDESHIYNVGVVDLFLPKLEWSSSDYSFPYSDIPFDPTSHQNDHLAIRILYPTLEEQGAIPYLRTTVDEEFCAVSMKYGAPPPLQEFEWMVHNWRLIQLPAKEHAQPLHETNNNKTTATSSSKSLLPIVIYSPGLGGSSEMYSYQTLSLAAQGFVVVVVEHGDGSLAVVPRKDGSVFRRNDDEIIKDWADGNQERHDNARRAQTEYRSDEMLAVTRHILELNRVNLPELEAAGLSFVGKLDTKELHFLGHSFGGATSLHAARKARKGLRPKSIVAHEPAIDFIPEVTRGSLFDKHRLKGSTTNYSRWTSDSTDDFSTSVHDFDLYVLFSHEWASKRWAGIDVLQDMQQRGLFGRTTASSRVEVLDRAHHIEFSDMSMITPTWLARAVGMTGEDNPLDSARDIHRRTLKFLTEVRGGRA